MNDVLLIGAGGHCKTVIEALNSLEIYPAGILDRHLVAGSEYMGVPVLGDDEDASRLFAEGYRLAFICVGSTGDSRIRKELTDYYDHIGYSFPHVVDASVLLGQGVTLGRGSLVSRGSIINTDVSIGQHCIINTGTVIEHDCNIGDYVHIAPGATLCGSVTIGPESHIGAGSVILQGLKVGKNSLVGAGSVVTKTIQDNVVAYGNPCEVKGDRI